MEWREVGHDDLKAMPSGAAALGPMSPSPVKRPLEVDNISWTPPWDTAGHAKAFAALQRCRHLADNVSRPEMEAALDPDALAYASAAVAAARAAELGNSRVVVPPLAIPHTSLPPPREKTEWHSKVSYESDGEEVLCGVPNMPLPAPASLRPNSFGTTEDASALWASLSDWLPPWLRPTESGSMVCCARVGDKSALSSRIFSAESLEASDSEEESEPERQSACWLPRDQAPVLTPPPGAAVVGPLGVPVTACRQRQNPLSAIYELPPQFSSGTFDEIGSMLLQRDSKPSSGLCNPEAELPDPAVLGIAPAEELARPPCGSYHGLGRVRRGYIGPIGRYPSVLLTELLLPRPLDSKQRNSVHAALRAGVVLRGDLAAPLGAVPATLECGGAGIWTAWSDTIGAAAMRQSPSLSEAQSGIGARPLHEVLRASPEMNASRTPGWRLAIARQIAAAVAGLHRTGRTHGSLTPCSIWVSPSNSTSIMETSIMEAGLVDVLLDAGVLHEHELLCCLGLEFARYLPPEGWQMPRRIGPAAGAAADVWAMALILLEVLGGASAPHAECKNLQQLSSKVLPKRGHQQAPRLRNDGDYGKLPEAARRKLEGCLNASPEARPRAEEVLYSLAAPMEPSCDVNAQEGSVYSEVCVQEKLQNLRVFSEGSTRASRTPSTSTVGEVSTVSSASPCQNAPHIRQKADSTMHSTADSSSAQDPISSARMNDDKQDGSTSCRANPAHCDSHPNVAVGEHQYSGAPQSSDEFYSGVIDPPCQLSGRPPSPPEPDSQRTCQESVSFAAVSRSRGSVSGHSDSLETQSIRTPRERPPPPPPPEPTFEEMLLALPTPVRNRRRVAIEKTVISQQVPPPPPAPAPPLVW